MTVKELIEYLRELPPDYEIYSGVFKVVDITVDHEHKEVLLDDSH